MSKITVEYNTISATPGTPAIQQFSSIDIDSVITERYKIGADIPEYPAEKGVDATDHSNPKLKRVLLDCIVTNSPLYSIGSKIGAWIPDPSGLLVFDYPIESDRPKEVYDQIVDLCTKGIPVTVIGARFGDLEDYLIEDFSVPVESDDKIEFSMLIKEFRTFTTETVEAPLPRVQRARRQRDNGRENTDEERGLESVARRGLQGLANLVGR